MKHIERFLHKNTNVSGADKRMCHYCEKMICCDDFDKNHIKILLYKSDRRKIVNQITRKGKYNEIQKYKI